MNRITFAVPAILAAGIVATAPSSHAQPTAVARAAPEVQLSAEKRTAMIRKVITATGAPAPTSVPAAQFKLYPAIPSNEGARITFMGEGTFQSPADDPLKSGWFSMSPRTATSGTILPSVITMKFPTVANKLYVFDCSVFWPLPPANPQVSWTHYGKTEAKDYPVEDNHALFVTTATTASTTVMLRTVGTASMNFRGCEITKVD